MTAAGEELALGAALGLDLGAAGEEDLLGETVSRGLGEGEALFSVVTDTVGSDAVGSGDGLSSWLNARDTTVNRVTLRQTTVIFIEFSLVMAARSAGCARMR